MQHPSSILNELQRYYYFQEDADNSRIVNMYDKRYFAETKYLHDEL